MFHTALCDLLGIRYPILQGAMQGAGGTERQLREDIARTREQTNRLFGVNITPIGAIRG